MSNKEKNFENPKIKSLRDYALETLRDAIITGDLKPGEHLNERNLSDFMGISTTPIKEAIRVLNYEGFVESKPRKGNYVSEFVDSSIKELLMLRAKLEGFAAKLATLKMTDEEINALEKDVILMEGLSKKKDKTLLVKINSDFHNKIRNASKNQLINNMLSNLVAIEYSFRKRALTHDKEAEIGISEHKLIFEAIKERNPDLVEKRLVSHIERSTINVLENSVLNKDELDLLI